MRRVYSRPGTKGDPFVGINPNRNQTAALLTTLTGDSSRHQGGEGKNFITLTESTVQVINYFSELKRYGYASTCFPFSGKEIQTDLEACKNPAPNHGEMMRTIGPLEIIGLLLKADLSDAEASAAHYVFCSPQRKPDGSITGEMSLNDFASHASKLTRALVDNPGALDVLCTAIVMSDLGKFDAFRKAAKEAGVKSTDPDHDVYMEHVLRELNDEKLGALCPSFGRLSERQRFLVRCMFELELNPGWVLQGECSPSHITKFLYHGATLDESYVVDPKSGYLEQLGWGEVDTNTANLVKTLLAYGVFFADISGARRHLGPMGTSIMNDATYSNYKRTILDFLSGEAKSVEEAFSKIVLGQAHQAGLYLDKDALLPEEVTFVRLAQLTRITQNKGKGWEVGDLEAAWSNLSDEARKTLVDNLGRSSERSFTVTYLPGIAGRVTDLADLGSKESRVDTLEAIMTFYRNMFESLHKLPGTLKGDLRVDGSKIRFDPDLTPGNEGDSSIERWKAACDAFCSYRVEALKPSEPGGTIPLKILQ